MRQTELVFYQTKRRLRFLGPASEACPYSGTEQARANKPVAPLLLLLLAMNVSDENPICAGFDNGHAEQMMPDSDNDTPGSEADGANRVVLLGGGNGSFREPEVLDQNKLRFFSGNTIGETEHKR